MRIIWAAGVAHALIGSLLFFLTLHPLRDALDPNALDSAKVGYAWQAMMGMAAMITAAATRSRLAGLLIVGGAAASMAMLSYIIFTGIRPAIMVIVPIGGMIATIGIAMLLFARPRE
jgi:uncharacterized membrane protein YgdD (TMEM256/DUF423 family)